MTLLYVPRYRTIEQAIRERVAALHPGDRLPSDSELSAEFGVSRMTARSAMQRLVEEGLILRDPGRGTFVAEPPTHRRANSLMSFTEEMRRQGRLPTSRLLARELRPALAEEAAVLRLDEGEQLVLLRRVRLADDEAIAIETTLLRGRCAAAVMDRDLEHGSLHAFLAESGIRLSHGQATITAEAADDVDAELLEIARGDPLLVERRLILDMENVPIERTESRYPAARYRLGVTFDVEATSRRGRSRPGRPG